MWIPFRSRHFGAVDIREAVSALAALPDAIWDADEDLKRRLAGDRQTQAVYLQVISTEEFVQAVGQGPLRQDQVPRYAGWEPLHAVIQPLVEKAISHFESGGVVLRIQLARMLPGSRIPPHIDSSPALMASHRLHVPLITSDGIRFMIDGEQTAMDAGNLYELNNRIPHWVENNGTTARTHLIIDYLEPQHDGKAVLRPGFDLAQKLERSRGNRPQRAAPRTGTALPTVLATSVIRGAHQSESHGGMYRVELTSGNIEQLVDWDRVDIDFSGRGWDRGLRGIACFDSHVFVVASNELYCFDRNFRIVSSYTNPYLKHAHEVALDGEFLYITSTGFDSILRFDLLRRHFDCAWLIQAAAGGQASVRLYKPLAGHGPPASNTLHLNNVFLDRRGLHVSGRQAPYLFRIYQGAVSVVAEIPQGTHNVLRCGDGLLFNDTESDRVVYADNYEAFEMAVPRYKETDLVNAKLGDDLLARQAFGRGLCLWGDGFAIGGSSPSTLTVYDLHAAESIRSINLSLDIRNAIHGLAIWPY